MRLLTFQAKRFRWKSHSRTLDGVEADEVETVVEAEVEDALVAFVHAESRDEPEEARKRAFKHTLKHVKWLANKRGFRNVVLHSFTHLGADNATPEFARGFLEQLAERLAGTGYSVATTPFGWFCEWDLSVYGESLAKVWKEV